MARRAALGLWLALCALGPLAAQTPALEGLADARWQHFADHLVQLAARENAPPLGMLQLGDSHTANSAFADRLRQKFQARYGDAGAGFLPAGSVAGHPVAALAITPSAQWRTQRERALAGHGGLGLGGTVGYGATGFQMLGLQRSGAAPGERLTVYASARHGSAAMPKLYQGREEVAPQSSHVLDASKSRAQLRLVYALGAKPGALNLLLGASGDELQLLGLNWQSERAGIVYSSVGVVGARLAILQEWDSATTQAQLRDLAPELMVLSFGTNDARDMHYSAQKFVAELQATARWLERHAPTAAVLLVLPPDTGRGPCGVVADPVLASVRALMRQAARQHRWRSWDWSALSARACAPGLAPFYAADGVHLTRQGYEASADALFDAVVGAP